MVGPRSPALAYALTDDPSQLMACQLPQSCLGVMKSFLPCIEGEFACPPRREAHLATRVSID
jgi:hypothetical protein